MTPNASFVSNGARSRRQISIRGVTNFLGFVGSGTTGYYIDDFSVAGSTINPPIMDIERIEILRGPQATYFGRNALGGGISITSKKPTNDFHGSVLADIGRFSTYNIEGIVNIPLMDDTLAMRLNVKSIDSDGNIQNPLKFFIPGLFLLLGYHSSNDNPALILNRSFYLGHFGVKINV